MYTAEAVHLLSEAQLAADVLLASLASYRCGAPACSGARRSGMFCVGRSLAVAICWMQRLGRRQQRS